MNKPTLSAVPDENEIEELLTKIQPVPDEHFHQRMKQAVWRNEGGQLVVMKNLHSKIAFVVITLAILTLVLFTPLGRAWAQEVFQFFHKVDFTTMQVSQKELEWYNEFNTTKESYDLPLVPIFIPTVAPELSSLPGCDTAEKAQSYSCQIAYAESQLGIDLMEFPEQPQNLEFQDVWFDTQTKFAMIEYESPGILLRLSQRLGKAPEAFRPWPWVPASDVDKIKVGPFDGEYVSGGFDLSTESRELVWKDTTSTQRIAWSDGAKWYLLDSSGLMNRDRLIELAASLVANPIIVEKQPDPEVLDITLTSISEAEAYSGLDLKAPNLLPIGFVFSEAHYTSFRKNEVSLHYEGNNVGSNSLVIHVKKDNSINFDTLSATQENSEVVKVNGQNAYYGFMEDGARPYLFLSWQDGDLNYRMYFYWYNDIIHGVINRQKMIAIAESMDDINVFKNKTPRQYEHVKIYAEALDIDIHEFSTIPAGWSFDGFWFDAWEKCIGLSYTLPNTQGRLFLNQCGTDRLSKIYDIPATAIEHVKVGKNRAEYITGNSEYDSNGNLVWLSDLPVQQLRWQENGLWIQIIVYGESALLHDKEDLIAIAESLR